MATKFFKIFRAGSHCSMAGKTIDFSEKDVSDIAKYYPLGGKKAPLVLGHPGDDGPALGMVLSLHEKRGALFATAESSDVLTNLVRAKQCAGVSCKFFTKDDPLNPVPGMWSLRHVGFMVGGMQPAIKDLGELAFSESFGTSAAECLAVEFSKPAFHPLPRHFSIYTFHQQAIELQHINPGMGYDEAMSIVSAPKSLSSRLHHFAV